MYVHLKKELKVPLYLLCCQKKRCGESQLTVDDPNFKEDSPDIAAIERGDWLTDTHISLVNEILKYQYQFPSISVLQNLLCGQNITFERMSELYVQIMHTDCNHWLAV